MKILGYARVSTDKQSMSVEVQKQKIRGYCELYGHELVGLVVDDGKSAKTLDRPGMAEVMRRLDAGEAEGLLVAKLDRLTRSVKDLGELVEEYFKDGRLAFLSVADTIDTSTASGRLVLNVLMSVAQWEREAIGERTSQVMQYMRENKQYTGGRVRYGYRRCDGGAIESNEEEKEIISLARTLRNEGMSLREVAFILEERGYVSRTGKPLVPSQIRAITIPG